MDQGDQASLRIKLLGRFEVWREGQLLEAKAWPQRKTQTLLKVLLSERGQLFTQDQLIDTLFPDLDLDKATDNLHKRVSELRYVLEPDLKKAAESQYILRTGQGYCFSKEAPCELDTEEFSKLCQVGQELERTERWSQALESYGQALELYRGPYLAEDAYEEWSLPQRERWREQYLQALGQMGECHARLRQYPQAIECCRKLIQEEPQRESAYRSLMVYQYYAGQPEEAVKTYEACAKALQEELETEPGRETQELHERIVSGDIPPLPQAIANNLPAPATRFVGREEELAQVAKLLEDSSCRLVTIVGPGGMGKTRLALEAAGAHLEKFPDGVYFVGLAGLSSADLLVSAIGNALKFSFYGQQAPQEQLVNYLREKRLLLVLDNFEHLLEGVEFLSEVLEKAAHVKLLATSRERLKLLAEWSLELEGLAVPQSEKEVDIESYSAVVLLLQTVRRVFPKYAAPKQERPHWVNICRLVGGMPLALELAGAWAHVLSLQEIEAEIERNLSFLRTSALDVPEKHRSIRAVFDYSMTLLAPEERAACLRLAVFRGGFRKEAAREVGRVTLAMVASLVDKSLVTRSPFQRYMMHELFRQYAKNALQADGAAYEKTRDLHCAYYADYANAQQGLMHGERHAEALQNTQDEIDNIGEALNWAIERKRMQALERAQHMLFLFYDTQGFYKEGVDLFKRMLAIVQPATEHNSLCAKLNNRLGTLTYHLAQYAQAESFLDNGLRLAEQLGDGQEQAHALSILGEIGQATGAFEQAWDRHQAALNLYRDVNDDAGSATSLNNLGNVAWSLGKYDEARDLHQQALLLQRWRKDKRGIASSLNNLGAVAHHLKEYEAAKRLFEEGLALRRELGDRLGIAAGLNNLGEVARRLGDLEGARRLHREALAVRTEIGDQLGVAYSQNNLGDVERDLGNASAAHAAYIEAIRLGMGLQAHAAVLYMLAGWAALLVDEDKAPEAAELLGFINNHPMCSDDTRQRVATLRKALEGSSPESLVSAMSETKTLEAVVCHILDSR